VYDEMMNGRQVPDVKKNYKSTDNECEDERANMVADARRDIGPELLQRRQKALQFAQLAGSARRWQLLLL